MGWWRWVVEVGGVVLLENGNERVTDQLSIKVEESTSDDWWITDETEKEKQDRDL